MASSIIIVITVVILFRHQQFNSSTLLRSLSYSVALSVRQAQLYGTSVRGETSGATPTFPGYGVYFASGNPTTYFLFADKDGNEVRSSDGSEDINTFNLSGGYQIKDFCAKTQAGADYCETTGEIEELTVHFLRPNPDALFSTDVSATYTSASIQLESPGGDTRSITVSLTGQISVGGVGT